jgi:hypothetical protein
LDLEDNFWAGGVARIGRIEFLPIKCEALSSNPNTASKKQPQKKLKKN